MVMGIPTYWCDVRSISISNDTGPHLTAKKLIAVKPGRASHGFKFAEERIQRPRDFDRLIYRTDPPVDLSYLHPLQILTSACLAVPSSSKRKPELINRPETLYWANEKFESWVLGTQSTPRFLITQNVDALMHFGSTLKKAVLKPLETAQSQGVELLSFTTAKNKKNAQALLLAGTHQETRPILLQEYLPQIHNGETRLWFVNGKLLAWVRKKPRKGEFRVNMDEGGFLEPCDLSHPERKVATRLERYLTDRKVRMAAIDLIAGKITDFNITSPGLLSVMEDTLKTNLARHVILGLSKRW